MGKDTELLEAARNGNLSVVEKILNQKSKRSGPLASLRRGPGANVQDSSGYSALHHAALNGHNDIIRLLLAHDASPNLPDARGSSPLHLAAWAGHQDIVKLFLTQPNRPANPNLQTIENETPLHCAARHGHTGALTTLLAHGADPNVKNNHNETPLDLAAQYGRLQVVQMLIRAHPELILQFKQNTIINDRCNSSSNIISNNYNNCNLKLATTKNLIDNNGINCGRSSSLSSTFYQQQSQQQQSQQQFDSSNISSGLLSTSSSSHIIFNHSPLHLASRNGHKNVVEVLLAAGVNVNLLTPSGTALHEAALCGKDIVVRTLLDYGADLDATDCEGRTALDILEEFPPHVTKGIVSVINNHRNSMLYDSESDDIQRDNSIMHHHNSKNYNITATTPMSLGSSYENNRGCSPIRNYSHHDITTSPSSSMGSLGPPSPRQRTSTGDLPDFYTQMTPIKNNQIAPKKPPRRNLYISPTHLSLSSHNGHNNEINNCDDIISIPITTSNYSGNNNGYGRINKIHSSSSSLSTTTTTNNQYYTGHSNRNQYYDKQYNQNNLTTFDNNSYTNKIPVQQKPQTGYEYVYMARTGPKIDERFNNRSKSVDQYVEMNIKNNEIQHKPKPAPRNLLANVSYENTTLKSYNPNRKLKRNRESYESFNIDFNKEKLNYDNMKNYPQSPTNYQQPPTPEHPPPLPSQAEKFIHDRIRPLSQEYKRISGLLMTIESGTSPQENLLHNNPLRASSGSISSSISISDRSVSTDCVEEFIGDVPFAGLFKGSTMNLNNSSNYQLGYYQQQQQQSNILKNQQQLIYQSDEQLLTSSMMNNCNLLSSSLSIDNNTLNNQEQQYNNQSISLNLHTNNDYLIMKNHQQQHQQHRSLSFDDILDNYNNDDNNIIKNIHNDYTNYDNNNDNNDDNNIKISLKTNINDENILSPFNENEAWAKISEIMESFGSGILSGTCIDKNNKINDTIDDNDDDDVDDNNDKINLKGKNIIIKRNYKNEFNKILNEWNLMHLEKNLIDNGFDNIEFMNGIIDENDIMAMNILETDSKKLIGFINKLPIAKSLPILYNNIDCNNSTSNCNTILNVDQWLQSIDLDEYINVFRKHLYTNMASVCRIWEVELQTVLQIHKLGHRKRILYSVAGNRKCPPQMNSDKKTIDVLNADLNILKANIMEIRDDDCIKGDNKLQKNNSTTIKTTSLNINLNRTNGPPIRHSNKKNRPAPKPPIQLPPTAPPQLLEIRAPSELLLGLPSNLRTQWRHTATSLVSGTVKYDVYYLGSTVVKELRGTESTRKSIQKLKRDNHIKPLSSVTITNQQSTTTTATLSEQIQQQNDKKRPIRLSISQRGVEFIDFETQKTICEHEIRNINCACQDADDLSHFAYITKDSDMNIHYCHVFNVDSMDLATEIILTLGQAFEVAYQLVLLDTTTTSLSSSSSNKITSQLKSININDNTNKKINNCDKNNIDSNNSSFSTTTINSVEQNIGNTEIK